MAFSMSKRISLNWCTRSFTGAQSISRSFKSTTLLTRRTTFKLDARESAVELPTSLKKIVTAFQMVPDPMARYKQLLYFASKLDPLVSEFHTEKNRVQGCVSQVWVTANLIDGLVQFRADSDSQLTKGLAALLVQGLSGCTPREILSIQPDFIEMLQLKQSLTPSRNNGFLNMFKLMQKRTLELATADIRSQQSTGGDSSSNKGVSSNAGQPPSKTPIEDAIREKLTEGLNPDQLLIINESSKHAGHMGNPNNDPETHFKLEIISSEFEGANSVKRHRMVYALLQEELAGPIHALTLNTKTPAEVK
eukprot:g5535.t1